MGHPLTAYANIVRITEVALGSITGAQSVTIDTAPETWITATLTGNTTVTLSNLTEGKIVKLFLTQDSTGSRSISVSDGIVSATPSIGTAANQTSVLTVFTPDGSGLVISGAGNTFAPVTNTTDYTLQASDAGKTVEQNSSSSTEITVPTDAAASFSIGDTLDIAQLGTGNVTVLGQAGMSLVSLSGNRKISGRYGKAKLFKRAANTWHLSGDLDPTTSFDPTGVAGLTGWYKADALSLSDGDAVGTWTDSSSGAHDATQGTAANKPTFQLKGRNGLPCVRFDGTNDYMTVAGIKNDTAARTIFVVGLSTAVNGCVWSLSDSASNLTSTSSVWVYKSNEASGNVSIGGSTSSLSLITLRFNTSSSADCYLNGSLVSNFDPKDGYQTAGSLALTLGAQANAASFWTGDICELMVYDAALSNTDRGNVETHLTAKWGL